MQRVINAVEKNVISIPMPPVPCPAGVSTQVLATLVGDPNEYSGRYIYNAGTVNLYYAFGHTVDATNYEGILFPNQQFNASNCGAALYANAIGGDTIVSRTILQRRDNTNVNANIMYPVTPGTAIPPIPES